MATQRAPQPLHPLPPRVAPHGRAPAYTLHLKRQRCAASPKSLHIHLPLKCRVCRFGFTAAEAVAISGAHNLGRAQLANSGFQGTWVQHNDQLGSGGCPNRKEMTCLKARTPLDLYGHSFRESACGQQSMGSRACMDRGARSHAPGVPVPRWREAG